MYLITVTGSKFLLITASFRLSYDPIMRTISLSRILLLTSLFCLHTRGYILGQGCPAYSNDIELALEDFDESIRATWSSLKPQNDAVEDWFGLLEPLFPGLSYSTPYAMQQWMLDPNYDVGPETISLTETFQRMSISGFFLEIFEPLSLCQFLSQAFKAAWSLTLIV